MFWLFIKQNIKPRLILGMVKRRCKPIATDEFIGLDSQQSKKDICRLREYTYRLEK